MMEIYHFANVSFGRNFCSLASEIKEKFPDAIVTLVISTIRYRKKKLLFRNKMRSEIRKKFSYKDNFHYDEIFFERDINSSSFFNKIKLGSIGFVTGFNQIFKTATIRKFKSLVNYHPSILPHYRGPVPSYWVLKNKEKWSGYTIHHINEGIDRGKAIWQGAIFVENDDTVTLLDAKIAVEGIDIFKDCAIKLISEEVIIPFVLDASRYYSAGKNYLSFPSV